MSASQTSEGAAPSDAHLVGEWARLLFGALCSAGVTDVWVSPGSRSTPFTYAAAATAGLTLRAVVDERSAAFMALGHARVTGRASAVLCTSGTAAANYFPAVIEAAQAQLPLILLTADRPADVQHAHAAQSIDQLKLYGDFARAFFDLGPPEAATTALVGLRRAVVQAVATALGPLPGPVHLNLRARKPLEPTRAQNDAERALSAQVTELLAKPCVRHAARPVVDREALELAARTLAGAASGVIVVGPLSAAGKSLAEPILQLAELTGYPIFAEASSQVRFATRDSAMSAPLFDWVLATPEAARRFRPDVIVQLGATSTSSAYERWAAHVPRRIVLAEHAYPDALGDAELVASGDLSQALPGLCQELKRLGILPTNSPFLRDFRAAHQCCEQRVTEALSATSSELTEAAAVKNVVEGMPNDCVLALGNSLPIREVDAYVLRAPRSRVVSQRGVSGIDGLVSGAIGSALGSGAPTLLLLGDVSLLHDLGALASARLVKTPLVIAVIDNAGGRIFDQLPVQKLYGGDAQLSELWLTPPKHDLRHAAALFELAYEAPTTAAAVRTAVSDALGRNQTTLLHVRVAPSSAADTRKSVLAAVAADLARLRG